MTWRSGREAQEEGDIRVHVAESRCCIAEINTTLQSNYTPKKPTNQPNTKLEQIRDLPPPPLLDTL